MKGTILSFLNVFRSDATGEMNIKLPDNGNECEQFSMSSQTSDECVPPNEIETICTQTKGVSLLIKSSFELIKEAIKSVSQLIKKKQTPDISVIDDSVYQNVSEPSLINDTIIDGDMDLFFKSILNQAQANLALSENINDVANIFKQAEELIGKADFVIAIMISYIREEKLWKRYNYNSIDDFLKDLPSVCKVSRQTFNNAAQAGDIIRYLSSLHPEAIVQGLNFSLTPALLYRNYSKLKFLYRIFYIWNIRITNEVMINFRDMTYRNFESFIKEYEAQNQEEISRNGKKIKESSQEKSKSHKNKKEEAVVPELTEAKAKIYREIRLGHSIGYLFTSNSEFTESVVRFLLDARKHKYEEIWKYSRSPSELFMKDNPDLCLNDLNWAEFFPGDLRSTTETLTNLISIDLAPHDIKNALAKSFKTKAELTLAQAFLIFRMENDSKLHASVKKYLYEHKITHQFNTVMDFAINVLDIEVSKYKWLKRIGESIPLLIKLKGKVHLTSDGFLEKLSYLKTAIQRHPLNHELVIEALNNVSAKRFREFARNKQDTLLNDPISIKDYLKAKPFIDELLLYQADGKSISIIGLLGEDEQIKLNNINRALEEDYERIMKLYPGIAWDSIFEVKPTVEIETSCLNNTELTIHDSNLAIKDNQLKVA